MICEKCGREMKRIFRMETWHCSCRKFLVSDVHVEREIWEHSPEKAAAKFANIRDFKKNTVVIVADGEKEATFWVKVWTTVKYEAKKL